MKYSFGKPYYNVASVGNVVAVEEANNVYFELMPQGGYAIRRRPGLRLYAPTFPNAVGKGIHWSDRMNKMYGVVNNQVFVLDTAVASHSYFGSITSSLLPVVFAEGQKLNLDPMIYMANGTALKYIDMGSVPPTVVTPVDSPPTSTFVTMMNNRFYANDFQAGYEQDFYVTDVNPGGSPPDEVDVTYWASGVNPFRAAQKPDIIKGMYSGWNEVYVWGSLANEVWQEDGVNPISPLMGSMMEIGLEAPYSVQLADNTMIALVVVQGKRAVVTVQGRSPKVISEPIANILQSYSFVSDAVSFMCYTGGVNLYVLSFPTEGVTWVYDIKTDVWTRWSSWDIFKGDHKIFDGRFGAYAKAWNKHIVMGARGDLYEISRNNYQDINDPYENLPIHSSIRTGWIDGGGWDRKRLDQLIIKLQGYARGPAKVIMRTRTDGFPEWSNPIDIDIQANQQNDHFCKLNRMGIHRSIQYEFTMTSAQDLALVGLEMDYTKMRN